MANHLKDDGREDPASVSLLTFDITFDFRAFVREQLIPAEGAAVTPEMVTSTAKMIGQERDGKILFAWDKKNNMGATITSVGLYSPSSKSYLTVFLHESRANICSATVNSDASLLAFTIQMEENNEKIYDCFISEIRPQGRVFTLNLEGPSFRMLQFVHSDMSASKNRMSRNVPPSRLLLIIPNSIICQYQFKLQQVRQGSVVVSQPEQEIIQRNVLWYQWDPHSQWLYYARFEGDLDQSFTGKNSLTLHCKSFGGASLQHLFTLSLPLSSPYKEQTYTSLTFYNSPFPVRLPVREINLQVLYRPDGFWCVCLQHCTGVASDTESKIDYSVYILHNGYLLYAQVPLTVPFSDHMYIHFMLIGCFVAAYIPGVMLHFLNIGPRVDPCHHLMFGPEMAGTLPVRTLEDKKAVPKSDVVIPHLLSSAVHIGDSPSNDYNVAFVECNDLVVYKCVLNVPGFFQLFKTCGDSELMEDILHIMIVGFQRNGLALSMIEHMCQTPMQMSDHRLIAEFIVASSFSKIYYECKHYLAKQLPLTTSPTFRGKIAKSSDGGKVALVKLSAIQNFVKQLLVQSDQKLVAATPDDLFHYVPPANQPFEILVFNAVVNRSGIVRVDIRELIAASEVKDMQQSQAQASIPVQSSKGRMRPKKRGFTKGSSSSHPSEDAGEGGGSVSGGFLSMVSTTFSRRGNPVGQVRSCRDPREMLVFLSRDEDLIDEEKERSTIIRQKMLKAIAGNMHLRLKNIVFNTLQTYYSDLEKQSCTVLKIIWESLGFDESNHPLHLGTICRQPSTKEEILFELLEAYHLAHLDLGIPLPNGFHTFFMAMGYLCLETGVFLQYLRNGVFTPTKRFVNMLIEDTSEEDAPIVFQVFSNLDYSLAKHALDHWRNPTIQQLEQPHQRDKQTRK